MTAQQPPSHPTESAGERSATPSEALTEAMLADILAVGGDSNQTAYVWENDEEIVTTLCHELTAARQRIEGLERTLKKVDEAYADRIHQLVEATNRVDEWAERAMRAESRLAAVEAEIRGVQVGAGEPVAIVRKSMTGGNAGLSRHVEITADFILNDGELLYTHPPAQRDGAAVAELKNIVNAKRFDVDVFEDDTQFADWAQSRARHILSAEEPKCQCLELHPDYCHVHAA